MKMSSETVESHVMPTVVSPENVSRLIIEGGVGISQPVVFTCFTDPNSGRTYLLKTALCKENAFPSIVNVQSTPEESEKMPETTHLKNDLVQSVIANVSKNNAVSNALGVSSIGSSPDGLPDEISLSGPTNQISEVVIAGAYSVLKSPPSLPETDSSESSLQGPYGIAKLLKPLHKYFQDNKCLICGFVSVTQDKFTARKHLVTHLTDKLFKCDICDKGFTVPERLVAHKAIHNEEFPFACDVCGKKFKTKGQLRIHMKRHNERKRFPCAFCEKEFSSKEASRQHQRIHTGEKPYECSVCNKKFRTAVSLRTHSYNHNIKKRFTCDICNKGYNRRTLLTEHINSHNSSNLFKCKICDKTFNFRSNLSQHMLTHSDVRKHTCETCGMKFKFPHHLKSHILTHETSGE